MNKYFCIFGGGGIRGCAYTGAIRALGELNIEITGLAGSSIGAVVAGLYTFGYTIDEMQNIFDNINFEFFKDLNLSFGKDFAISTGNNFYEWIKTKIEDKFYGENVSLKERKPVCFKDLKKELIVLSVDLTTSKFHEFSKEKTPDAEIAQAIRSSVAMPGLYSPVFNENECLADGDLSKSAPLWKVLDSINKKSEKILELRLENNETKKKISNTFDYLNAVYDTVSGIASDSLIETYGNFDKYDMIKINTENVSVIDFMAGKEKKAYMAHIGYNTIIDYFKNKYPIKSKKLFEIYNNAHSHLQKIHYFIKENDLISAKYEAVNILAELIQDKEIIDVDILNKIINFKEDFNNSYIIKKGLFSLKPALTNKNKITEELIDLEEKLILKKGEFAQR